jgi:uncharacterized membrane protein YhiD involved in acid resistance
VQTETIRFPATPIALKMTVALGIGMLVGLEREWSNKDVGIRTFAIVALLGMLAAIMGPGLIITSFDRCLFVSSGDERPQHAGGPFT